MNKYYNKSIFEKFTDFILDITKYLYKFFEFIFEYIIYIGLLAIFALAPLLLLFDKTNIYSKIINIIILSPPIIQIYILIILVFLIIVSILPKIFTNLEEVFFSDPFQYEIPYISLFTGIPLVIFIFLTYNIIVNWKSNIPIAGTWPIIKIVLIIALATIFTITMVMRRIIINILYSFTSDEELIKIISYSIRIIIFVLIIYALISL